jgi:hypothetical protein
MDPNHRALIRSFLALDEVLERVRGDEDERDALLDLVPEPELRPHVVSLPAARVRAGAHVGPLVCPDCTRGLTSRGHDLICSQLPASIDLRGDLKTGRIVACGEGLTDG